MGNCCFGFPLSRGIFTLVELVGRSLPSKILAVNMWTCPSRQFLSRSFRQRIDRESLCCCLRQSATFLLFTRHVTRQEMLQLQYISPGIKEVESAFRFCAMQRVQGTSFDVLIKQLSLKSTAAWCTLYVADYFSVMCCSQLVWPPATACFRVVQCASVSYKI